MKDDKRGQCSNPCGNKAVNLLGEQWRFDDTLVATIENASKRNYDKENIYCLGRKHLATLIQDSCATNSWKSW